VVDSQSVKSTAVGAEERGFDGGKKVKGRKRHLLVDTAKASCSQGPAVHSAKVMDFERASKRYSAAGQRAVSPSAASVVGRGLERGEDKGAEKGSRRPWAGVWISLQASEEASPRKGDDGVGSREWAKEGVAVDWRSKLMPPEGFVVLPRRWVVERTIAWIDQQRSMSLWITRGRVRAGKL
jgi:putative transposase